MDSAQKTLIDIASVSQRVVNTLVRKSGRKTVESFRLDKIVVGSGAVLETLNKALFLRKGNVDDRLADWLDSEEPRICLDTLNRMETLLNARLDHGVKRNFFQGSRLESNKDNSNEAIRLFQKHKDYFHFLLTAEIWNREGDAQQQRTVPQSATVMRIGEAVDNRNLTQATQLKKLKGILKWLNALKSGETHERTVLLRQPDTCTWLPNTNAYKAWKTTENSFLWLHGKAGAGKSVLASSVIEGLKGTLQDGEVLVLFFCDFRNERSTSATEVMRSLLSQLLQQFCHQNTVDPGDLIEELFEEKDGATSIVSNGVALARYISRAAKQFSRQPFLVIDALDECKDVERLLDALLELNKGGVRLFVTSRPLQVIKDGFLGLPSISMDAMKHAVSADIRLHVARELDSHRRLRIVDASLKNEIYTALCRKADGMFRWVECQLNILKRCVTAVRIREALDDLPADLNATYERILLNINQDKHEGEIVRRALDWLVAALEPLQLPQVMEGLSIDLKQRTMDCDFGPVHGFALLDVLGSLVTYDEVTDVIILSHFSVKEYLIGEPTRTKLSIYHIDQQAAHERLALLCMCYASIYLRKSATRKASHFNAYISGMPRDASDMAFLHPTRRREPSSESQPLLEYVISHGLLHFAHINPRNKVVLKAIEILQSDARQHPAEWEQLCERAHSFEIPWPTLEHDVMLYILIAVAPEPLLRSFIGRGQLKSKDGTNPLIYAAYFHKIEHARTLLSRGVSVNCRGWHIGGYRQVLPIQVVVYTLDWDFAMFDLFLTKGSSVPSDLFVQLLQDLCTYPGHIVSRLLQTDDFADWAINAQFQGLLLRLLDFTRYLNGCPSEQEASAIERRLVQIGCDPPARFSETSLRQAASAGHVSTVKHILSQNTPLPPDIILDASRSRESNAAMIRLLLSMEGNVNVSSSAGDTPLHLVMTCYLQQDDCLESVQVLIDAGCNPSTHNLVGDTPFHLAVMHGYISVVEYLLSLHVPLPLNILLKELEMLRAPMLYLLMHNGAGVHGIAANGDTHFHLVLNTSWFESDECLECAKIMIDAGCNPFSPNALGETPFDIAAKNGRFDTTECLLSLNLPLPSGILLSMAGSRHAKATPTIKLLIDKGADIHVTCPNGDTLLHLSMRASSEADCLRRILTLVNAGCDPFARNLAGNTSFHAAAKHRHIRVMEYLLSLGISVPPDIMLTQFESFYNPDPPAYCPAIRFLCEKGGNIQIFAENGDHLLHRVTKVRPEHDALESVKFLVHAECSPQVINSAHETPIHTAAQYSGYISVINYLLSLDIPLPPNILLAASSGYSEKTQLIRYLIDKGANIAVVTTDGDTPLHLLLAGGEEYDRLECVRILIDAGCDPLSQNLAGETPLHSAAREGFIIILEYLLSKSIPLPHDILLASGPTAIRFLLEKGIVAAANGGPELMHRALDSPDEETCLECARILMGLGWGGSERNSAGETIMHVAARNGQTSTIKYLLSQNVPIPSNILLAVMQSAVCQSRHLGVPVTRFLVHEGASVNTTTSDGDTPLHLVLQCHFQGPPWNLVQLLLSCGSDPYARNAAGKTPCDLAEEKGHLFKGNFLRLVQESRVQRLGSQPSIA